MPRTELSSGLKLVTRISLETRRDELQTMIKLADTDKRLRAVIYARYSTELQSNASVEDQVRLCRDLIERHGFTYLLTLITR